MYASSLAGFSWLLLLQTAGELLSRALALPLPGPVLGMVLLLVALAHPAIRATVAPCAEFLLSHLSLLFVPVAVGVVSYLSLLMQYGLQLFVVLVLSTWIGLGVTVAMLRLLPVRGDAEIR